MLECTLIIQYFGEKIGYWVRAQRKGEEEPEIDFWVKDTMFSFVQRIALMAIEKEFMGGVEKEGTTLYTKLIDKDFYFDSMVWVLKVSHEVMTIAHAMNESTLKPQDN